MAAVERWPNCDGRRSRLARYLSPRLYAPPIAATRRGRGRETPTICPLLLGLAFVCALTTFVPSGASGPRAVAREGGIFRISLAAAPASTMSTRPSPSPRLLGAARHRLRAPDGLSGQARRPRLPPRARGRGRVPTISRDLRTYTFTLRAAFASATGLRSARARSPARSTGRWRRASPRRASSYARYRRRGRRAGGEDADCGGCRAHGEHARRPLHPRPCPTSPRGRRCRSSAPCRRGCLGPRGVRRFPGRRPVLRRRYRPGRAGHIRRNRFYGGTGRTTSTASTSTSARPRRTSARPRRARRGRLGLHVPAAYFDPARGLSRSTASTSSRFFVKPGLTLGCSRSTRRGRSSATIRGCAGR